MNAEMVSNSVARLVNTASTSTDSGGATNARTTNQEIVSIERAQTNQNVVTETSAAEATATDSSEIADKVKQAADTLNQFMSQFDKRISFDVYDDTDQMYVKVIDKETNKVLRTYPPEELLDAAARMHQVLGIIFDQQA